MVEFLTDWRNVTMDRGTESCRHDNDNNNNNDIRICIQE